MDTRRHQVTRRLVGAAVAGAALAVLAAPTAGATVSGARGLEAVGYGEPTARISAYYPGSGTTGTACVTLSQDTDGDGTSDLTESGCGNVAVSIDATLSFGTVRGTIPSTWGRNRKGTIKVDVRVEARGTPGPYSGCLRPPCLGYTWTLERSGYARGWADGSKLDGVFAQDGKLYW